ncbi:MAG: ankyrin repeat domain-containing protein [Candidatus Eremiobacteraeota bacterium]|nr:ankyrin repeat domain-containing protein [Candidatus Eremiobacteraeota bacterium]MCW5867910.1 ankyrin repeat domain-containing protein [Candidatus Eremiobacteraeota bacterium]
MTRQANLGLLTLALSFIALGTVGPFALILLGVLFALLGAGGGQAMGAAMASMMAMVFIIWILLILAFVGQIMCFFTPLSQETKTKLGVCMGLSLLQLVMGGGIVGSIMSLVGLLAYLAFLYGLCQDLEAPELASRFNSAAGFGLISLVSCIMAPFSAFLSPGLVLIFLISAFLFGALAFARYAQTIVSLAQRANQLRLQGIDLNPGELSGPGFSRFEEEVPAKPARPPFHMEWCGLIQLPPDLSGPHEATRVGDTEKVAAMLRPGQADLKGPNGMTPLHVAAISGVMQVADMLLKKGANVDAPCDGGLTALYFAIQNNNNNMVGLLLMRGASLSTRNEQGRTPLHWACAVASDRLEGQARVRMVQMLLSKGADPQAQDNDGCTPAQLAEKAGHHEVAAAL